MCDFLDTALKVGFYERHGLPCGSAGKESACNAGDLGFNPWVGKIPWRRERLSTPLFWPGEFLGLYGPWGHKELDTTERLSLTHSKRKGVCWKDGYQTAHITIGRVSESNLGNQGKQCVGPCTRKCWRKHLAYRCWHHWRS